MGTEANEADRIRACERERLAALVAGNVAAASELHADDFQLITPGGRSYSKEGYLEAIATGAINYLVWEPDTIEVRLYGQAAVIRYQAQAEVVTSGHHRPPARNWHIDVYEQRRGRWQVVWSQATTIQL